MKKIVVTLLILGIIGGGAYGGCRYFMKEGQPSGERISSDSEDAVYVDQVSAITGYGSGNGFIERFGGEVKAQETVKIKLESERKVKECFVKTGERIKTGQKLFRYDTQEDEDKLAQAQIDIERAQDSIEVSKKTIQQLEKERAKAGQEDQLIYTTDILSQENSIKKDEYEVKSKQLEITNLQERIKNSVVTSDLDGTIQKISDPDNPGDSMDSGSDYITILADGNYRVKGKANEQNFSMISEGMEMLIHSRLEDGKTWKGTISEIITSGQATEEDTDNSSESSNYAFYVELENSDGLLLGQHVYLEQDVGQEQRRDGLWLEDIYLVQEEDQAFVWKAGEKNQLVKQEVTLGDYDEEQMKYEILSGLSPEDYIAYPEDTIREGTPVIYNDYAPDNLVIDENAADNLDGLDEAGNIESADNADVDSLDGIPVENGIDEVSVEDDVSGETEEIVEDTVP